MEGVSTMANESESVIQNKIMIALNKGATRVFRNNVGAYNGKDGQWIEFGLRKGSGDLIGWRTVEITPEMVGTKIAQFLSVEVKSKTGKVREEQLNWQKQVNNAGGIAIIARSVEEV